MVCSWQKDQHTNAHCSTWSQKTAGRVHDSVRDGVTAHFEEHAVALLHDVGLVHSRHPAAVVKVCKLKCILGRRQRACLGDDL
jgi:hypothetical protein